MNNNNMGNGHAAWDWGIGMPQCVEPSAACGWPEAGDGFSAILWLKWLNGQWVTLSSPERQATLRMLRELALGELAEFQRRARTRPPACQVLCAGLAAEHWFGKGEGRRAAVWGLCDPALLYLPRVVGRGVVQACQPEEAGVEEGTVSMRAIGDSSWHAEFIARRAAERGWHRIWVGGSESFVNRLIEAAERRGIAVGELMADASLS